MAELDGLVGTTWVSDRLRISRSMISYLVRKGRLKVERLTENGDRRFNREVVEQFAKSYMLKVKVGRLPLHGPRGMRLHNSVNRLLEGDVARNVFGCFKKGMSLQDTVLDTGVSPGHVRELWEEWCLSLTPPEQVVAAHAQKIELRRAELEVQHERTRTKRLEILSRKTG